jgi:HD-like signal output (HDOD) protein
MSEMTGSVAGSLTEEVSRVLETGQVVLPPLPALGDRLRILLEDEEKVSLKSVGELIQTDPAVAATLLKTANSALFAGLSTITDLPLAISRLGLKQVGSLVTTLLYRGHFQTKCREREELLRIQWTHAVSCALICRRLAEVGGDTREEAYLAGLLHDVGKLLVYAALDHLASKPGFIEPTPSTLAELMNVLHTTLGYRVLKDWASPGPIAEAALHHHEDAATMENVVVVRVQAANAISRKIGHHDQPDPEMNVLEDPAVERLRMGDVELAELMVDVEDEIERILGLL